ncbi:helix-turn-helix domain-containing protein [Nocardioides sp.]|uniref:helix-turn-helix domain-containing protein n=1 Tax=Nocardioides sp. TaxID=35761 RepID=UPI0039E53556
MRKALEHAGMTNDQMAEYLGVGPATISRWTRGHSPTKRGTRRLWALRTGVSLEWLETGKAPRSDGPEGLEVGEVVRHQGLEPRTR